MFFSYKIFYESGIIHNTFQRQKTILKYSKNALSSTKNYLNKAFIINDKYHNLTFDELVRNNLILIAIGYVLSICIFVFEHLRKIFNLNQNLMKN